MGALGMAVLVAERAARFSGDPMAATVDYRQRPGCQPAIRFVSLLRLGKS